MRRLCLLAFALAACSGSKGSSAQFVFEDPHPEAREIVYVPPRPTDPAAPIIDEIRVAKDVVCDGESNLVHVRAHTTDGHDADLLYRIPTGVGLGGETGPALPVVFVSSMADYGAYTWPDVLVFDRGPHGTSAPPMTRAKLPGVLIRPCRYPELRIDARGVMNADSTFSFQASAHQADGFAPVTYHWDFGDGTSEDTTGPVATHDYWRMPETTAIVQLLVQVMATDARGQTLTGYLPIDWPSMDLEYPRSYGQRYVHSEMIGDRSVDASGVVYQDWLLWHHEDGPVVLDRAALSPDDVPFDISLAATVPGAPGGPVTVPPGEQLRVTVRHDFSGDPADLTCVNIDLRNGDPQPAVAHVVVFEPL